MPRGEEDERNKRREEIKKKKRKGIIVVFFLFFPHHIKLFFGENDTFLLRKLLVRLKHKKVASLIKLSCAKRRVTDSFFCGQLRFEIMYKLPRLRLTFFLFKKS